MTTSIGRQAVVVGAGIGGLAAAKALSDHFETVTVFDRDVLPEKAEPRAGTPQSRHAHGLLAGGEKALGALFPAIAEDLEQSGAVKARMGFDLVFERPGYDPFPKRDLGFDVLCLSRPLLEFVIRGRVGQQDNIILRSGCRVAEFLTSRGSSVVSGIRIQDAENCYETMETDLVVDATGRGDLTTTLLERVGVARPSETAIVINQGYSTAVFDIPANAPADWMALTHLPSAPENSRLAFIFPLEQGRWMVSLGGNHDDAPPGDLENFVAFTKTLRTPTVYDAIKRAKHVGGGVSRYNFASSVRRHFESLSSFPQGLVPIGDAICRVNPVFGQGMSVAAQEAAMLARLLGERSHLVAPLDGLAQVFFAEVRTLLEAPWSSAVNDFIYSKTRGDRPDDLQRRLQFRLGLLKLAAEDADVHKLVAEVNNLLRPQSALRTPEIKKRVAEIMSDSV